MIRGPSNKKIANSLVALSSAAILAVYSAGYSRTRGAARRLEAQAAERRPAIVAEVRPAAIPASVTSVPAPVTPSAQPPNREAATKATAEPHKPFAPAAPPAPEATPVPAVEAPVLPPPVESGPQAAAPAESLPVVAAAPPPPPPPAPAPAPPPAPKWKDGTYYGWGSSRHGDIQAAVVIDAGKIASATIAQCLTRYSCSVISRLPPQVAQRQSPEVDYVSGATQSTNAFYYAVVDALNKAK